MVAAFALQAHSIFSLDESIWRCFGIMFFTFGIGKTMFPYRKIFVVSEMELLKSHLRPAVGPAESHYSDAHGIAVELSGVMRSVGPASRLWGGGWRIETFCWTGCRN